MQPELSITHDTFIASGIFGELTDNKNNIICMTGEHAYLAPDGSYIPKLPPGRYLCVKGDHTLEHHPEKFQAFEITEVPGHSKMLLHIGNWCQIDSEGCVLLGEQIGHMNDGGLMICQSKPAFKSFMLRMKDVDSFWLTVENKI